MNRRLNNNRAIDTLPLRARVCSENQFLCAENLRTKRKKDQLKISPMVSGSKTCESNRERAEFISRIVLLLNEDKNS